MLKNLLKLTLILTPAVAFGQSKYDMGAAMIVENYRQAASVSATAPATVGNEAVTLVVSVDGDATLGALRDMGALINSESNNVAVVTLPVKDIETMAQLPGVISIEHGNMQHPMMYFARESASANAVIDGTGEGLTQPYTGQGVITGLMDQGIDPNHVAFFNDDQSASRVKAVYTYMNANKIGTPNAEYLTPEAIAKFTSDNAAWTHGTHVAAIMAGGYRGTSDYGMNRRIFNSQPMPYYGLASGSDIVMCGGYLYNDNILDGVSRVIDYAKSVDKPAVVNLSLGSVPGPHDGTSATSRYLAGKGKEAIIVIAAGNDGESNCALNTNFNRLVTSVTTGITITDDTAVATADFWYSTSDSFKFEFLLYNISTREATPFEITETGRTVTVSTSDATFASAFASGSKVQMYANVDPVNNRYYVRAQFYLRRGATSKTNIVPAVRITGAAGKKLNSTIDNGEFASLSIPGAVNGTPNGSVSDMATGENIIVVGAYTSSKSFTNMEGSSRSFMGATDSGQLCPFSSYGITFQGNKLPDLCAPGSAIVSAVNTYAYSAPTPSQYSAVTTFNKRKNYWAVMQGTSMACPFVAGTAALMLEADPSLDVEKVRSILKETADLPSGISSDDQMKWGAGRVNVLEAVKKVLDEKASVGAIWADDVNNFIVTAADGGYNVYVAGESRLNVAVYDTAGRTVASASADDNNVTVATGSLLPGIYILTAQGPTQSHSTKIIVK